MNNEHESTYTLLVRSEEKNRGIAETMVYALLGVSVIVSIWQFVEQSNRLPIDGVASSLPQAQPVSHHQVKLAVDADCIIQIHRLGLAR